jgi:hypothetical protein
MKQQLFNLTNHNMARRLLVSLSAVESRIQSHTCTHGTCGEQSGNETNLSPSTSVIACHYNFTNAPYSFIQSLPKLY